MIRRPFTPRIWLMLLLTLLAAPLLAARSIPRPHPPRGLLRHPSAAQLNEIDQVSDSPGDPALKQQNGESDGGDEEGSALGDPTMIAASRLYVLVSTSSFDVVNTASGCTRDHIYFPQRFIWKGCRVITGIADGGVASPDGDIHARLRLDPQFRSMLTAGNVNFYGGWLVLEQPCVHPTNKKYVGNKCTNYRGKNPKLKPGARYRLVGNYVIDTQHYHWAELHGLSSIQLIG